MVVLCVLEKLLLMKWHLVSMVRINILAHQQILLLQIEYLEDVQVGQLLLLLLAL